MSEASSLNPQDHLKDENKKYYHFINLGLFLAVVTGIEIVIIFFPWNPHLIFWVLVVLSVVKFLCVIAWFMHLIYDRLLLTLVFFSGLIIGTGTVAALLLLFSANEVDFDAIETGWKFAPPAKHQAA